MPSLQAIDVALSRKRQRIEAQLGRSITTAAKAPPRPTTRKASPAAPSSPPKGAAKPTAKLPPPTQAKASKATKATKAPGALSDSRLKALLSLTPTGRQTLARIQAR